MGKKRDTIKGPNKANEKNERKEGKIYYFFIDRKLFETHIIHEAVK